MSSHRFSFAKLKTKLGSAAGGAKLYGREKEEAALREAFQRTVTDCQQELILISGQPGTGKTALANTLRTVVMKEKGYFVAGKFEEQNVTEPYEVFVSALTEYVDELLDSADDARLEQIRESVSAAVGNEGLLLTQMVPALNRIMGVTEPKESYPAGKVSVKKNYYGTEAQNRFRFVFCKLIHSLAISAPLVLFLDDLQWADTASVEMVRNLMHTAGMPLLLLGAHRCDLDATPESEADPTQMICIACMQMKPFMATMKDLEKERTRNNLRMKTMDLKNLDAASVNVLLRDLLHDKTQLDTMTLAEVVIQQTQGNIFHILQFLRLLLEQGVLKRNENDQWTWDIKDNSLEPQLRSQTIMELVRKTMENLPRLAQEALKVASCMGDEIDDSALDLVLQTTTGKHLERAAEEGLLVFYPQFGGYRFAHDWIRQTAYEMTPKRERDEFHLRIGRKLLKGSGAVAIEKNIFIVVSLLNKGIKQMKEERERYKVAELNLQAAEKAASVSAFPDASKFARRGIQLLARNRWDDSHYELSLSLFSLASEVESINGNYERVVLYIEEIINHGKCLEDKLRAYAALIRSMGQQDNLEEATNVGIDVLAQLGVLLPPKPTKFAIVKELIKVKVALRGRKHRDLLCLPRMTDSVKIATLQILNLIFVSGYKARSPYTPLVAFRSIILTIKYGLHESSSVAFAVYGTMLCGLGINVKAGRRYGELAVSMAEKIQSREDTPMVHYMVGGGINHWTGPIRDTFADLLFASRSAMEIGDAEVAVMAKLLKCVLSFYSGTKIEECMTEIDQCIRTARLYRKHSSELLALITLQMMQCFSGLSKNPAKLSGDAINFNDVMKECVDSKNRTWVASLYLFSMELAYAFGDFECANIMAEGNRDLQKTPSALFMTVENRYKEGLIAIALARQEKQKGKNMKIGKEMLKKMTAWAKNSPQNCMQKRLLLEAELLSLKGPRMKDKVYALYEQAIKTAEKMDYQNEVALIYERFADFKHQCGDRDAVVLCRKSVDAYNEWGASAKGAQLLLFLDSLENRYHLKA